MKRLIPCILAGIVICRGGVSHAASWSFEVVEAPPPYDFSHWYVSSLALDAGGMPQIAYVNIDRPAGGRLLTFASKGPGGWQIEYADTAHDADAPALLLDVSGVPHISYTRTNGLYYARRDGAAWSFEPIFNAGGWGTLIPCSSITLAADGPCVSYTIAETGADWLKYSYRRATGWMLKDLNRPSLTQGVTSSLAVDPQDVSHIAYTELNDGGLWHAAGKGGAPWDYERVAADASPGSTAALACDSSGRLHLAYLAAAGGDSSLAYGLRDAAGWHLEAVGEAPSSGAPLTLGPADEPCILYFYRYNDVIYAYRDGGAWRTENVSAAASRYTLCHDISLAVDASGRPHATADSQFGLVYGKRSLGLSLDCRGPNAWGSGIEVDVDWSFRGIENTVDAYLAIRPPGGGLLFLGPGLALREQAVPIVRGMRVSGDMRGTLALTAGAKPPRGEYTFMAVCVPTGSPVADFSTHLGDGINEDVVDVL